MSAAWKLLGMVHDYDDLEQHVHSKKLVWPDTKKPRTTYVHVRTVVYGLLRGKEYAETVWQRGRVYNGHYRDEEWMPYPHEDYRIGPRRGRTPPSGYHWLAPWRCIQRLPS